MSPEDVARRFERKSGYELIDYAPVVLPLHRLTVDAVTMVHSEISPIREFAMRSIAAGLSRLQEISDFLGLDEDVIRATLDQLKSDHYTTGADDALELTERGREVLIKAMESSPQDEMQVFLYDRLLRRPLRLTAEELIAPANVDLSCTIEIRPYPADGPEIGDLSLADVGQILQAQAGGRAPYGRDLLKLKRIVRRVRLFRPAVALVFKKIRSSEIQVEFFIDDVRQETLSHAFAERGGPKKMGFLKAIDESSTANELRKHLGPEVQKLLPDSETLEKKRLAVSMARIKLQAAIAMAQRGGAREEDVAETDAVLEARSRLDAAEEDLREFSARPIAPFELADFFERGLGTATKRLLISTKSIDRSVVTPTFLVRLKEALDRRVNVRLSSSDLEASHTGSVVDLERLRERYQGLHLVTEKRSAFFHLVCDEEFAVVSNRPFLGNIGKYRSFQRVSGYLLQRADLVGAFAERIIGATPLPAPSSKVPRLAR